MIKIDLLMNYINDYYFNRVLNYYLSEYSYVHNNQNNLDKKITNSSLNISAYEIIVF